MSGYKLACWYGAMVAVAAAGIFEVIDPPSMIALAAVLVIAGPRGRCRVPA